MSQTAYDAYPYMSQAYAETHIDRLFTVAHLFAMDPVPVEVARVLEIGCADGANLVPMAEALPDSHFVGIDLSKVQIDAGIKAVAPLALPNLELIHGDFADLPDDAGLFDYIIVHGVFSWIPVPARAVLMGLIAARLSPQGVAYVSYNCDPGYQRRRVLRDFVRMHVDDPRNPANIGRVRQMLRWLHEASSPESDEGQVRRRACESMLAAPTAYLLHGLLAEHNHPLYFQAFLAEAGVAGLGYLGDADFGSMLPERLYPQARLAMESAPGGLEEHEQIQDYLLNRSFRRSLLVHADRKPVRAIPWERAESLWVGGRAELTSGRIDDSEEACFEHQGTVFTTDDPVLKCGLAVLHDAWPRNLRFVDWIAITSERSKCSGVVTRATLGRNLLGLYGRDIIELRPRDLGAAPQVEDRPCTTRWARRRIEAELPVTDLRHGMRRLPRIPTLLLPLLDGKHNQKQLLKALKDARRLGHVRYDASPQMALSFALNGLLNRSVLVR